MQIRVMRTRAQTDPDLLAVCSQAIPIRSPIFYPEGFLYPLLTGHARADAKDFARSNFSMVSTANSLFQFSLIALTVRFIARRSKINHQRSS